MNRGKISCDQLLSISKKIELYPHRSQKCVSIRDVVVVDDFVTAVGKHFIF